MEVPMQIWRKRRVEIVSMKDRNGSQNGADMNKAELERRNVGIGVFSERGWVRGVLVVTAGCLSKADAAESASDIV